MEEMESRGYNYYWRWSWGPVLGFEMFNDSEGGTTFLLHLLFLKLLLTKDDLST